MTTNTTPETAPSDPSSETPKESKFTSIENSKTKIKAFDISTGSVSSELTRVLSRAEPDNYGLYNSLPINQEHLLNWINQKTSEFHPLPMAIRWFKVSGHTISAVIESSPRMQPIYFYPAGKIWSVKEKAIKIKIPIPWVQMGVSVSLVYDGDKIVPRNLKVAFIAFTDKPLGPGPSPSKQMYSPLLPNTFVYDYSTSYKSGSVCYEATIPKNTAKKLSLAGIFSYMVNDYWNSTFNYNLPLEGRHYSKFLKASGGKINFKDIPEDSTWRELGESRASSFTGVQAQVLYRWSQLSIEDIMDLEKYGFPKIDTEAGLYKKIAKNYHAHRNFDPFSVYDAKGTKLRTAPQIMTKDGWKIVSEESVKEYKSSARALHSINHVLSEMYAQGAPKVSTGSSFSAKGFISNATRGSTKKMTITYDVNQGINSTQANSTTSLPPDKISEAATLLMSHFNSGEKTLPPGLRYWNPIKQVIVFERPPSTRRIYWDKNYKEGASQRKLEDKKYYDIWLPWTQYWVSYNAKRTVNLLHVTTASSSLSKPGTVVGLLPLSNIYHESRVCLPNSIKEHPDLTSLILSTYQLVWSSNYNMDLSDAVAVFLNSLYVVRDEMLEHYPEDLERLSKLVGHEQSASMVSKFLQAASECNPENILKLWPRIPPVVPGTASMHPSYDSMCPNHGKHFVFCECPVKTHEPFTAQEMATYILKLNRNNWLSNQVNHTSKDANEPAASIFLKYANTYASKMLH